MWVLLHGFTGSPRSWDPVLARMTCEPPPLVPALFGHAPGWRDLRVRSFEDEVERLCELSSRTNRPRFLAGYSLGARLAVGMLSSSPRLFDGALLLGVHPGLSTEAERRSRREADEGRARQLESEGLSAFIGTWETQPIFDTQRRLPETVLASQRQIRLAHDPEGLAAALRTLGLSEMPSYGDSLCSSGVPTTLMAGELDSKFVTLSVGLAARCSRLDAIIVEGAGHNLRLEASDAVADALQRVEQRALEGVKS